MVIEIAGFKPSQDTRDFGMRALHRIGKRDILLAHIGAASLRDDREGTRFVISHPYSKSPHSLVDATVTAGGVLADIAKTQLDYSGIVARSPRLSTRKLLPVTAFDLEQFQEVQDYWDPTRPDGQQIFPIIDIPIFDDSVRFGDLELGAVDLQTREYLVVTLKKPVSYPGSSPVPV